MSRSAAAVASDVERHRLEIMASPSHSPLKDKAPRLEPDNDSELRRWKARVESMERSQATSDALIQMLQQRLDLQPPRSGLAQAGERKSQDFASVCGKSCVTCTYCRLYHALHRPSRATPLFARVYR